MFELCVSRVIFPTFTTIFCDDFKEFSLASHFYISERNLPGKILETLRKLRSASR